MRAAVIENGKVTNIIVVESLDIFPNLVDAEGANIGDDWDGVQFSKNPAPTPEPTPPRMTEEEKEALLLAQSEMIALLFDQLQGGGAQWY